MPNPRAEQYPRHANKNGDRTRPRLRLDCGDGVGEVTALALVALKTPELAADCGAPTESGDSEDSV